MARKASMGCLCGCNLPKGNCMRRYQDDFVLRNGLPCRFPRSNEEWVRMQARAAEREAGLMFAVLLLGSLAVVDGLLVWCWVLVLRAVFGGA